MPDNDKNIPDVNKATTIEDILFSTGLIDENQVSAIKFESVNTGKSTEDIIKDKKIVDENDLIKAKGQLYKIPYVDLDDETLNAKALETVPEAVAKKLHLFPFKVDANSISLAMADPLDLQSIEFIERKSGKKVTPYISTATSIDKAVFNQYGKSISTEVSAALQDVVGITEIKEEGVGDIQKEEKNLKDAPVARIVNTIMEYSAKSGASDIHIEAEEDKSRVRYRIDGILREKLTLPKKVHNSLVARIKIMANLKIDERRLPQDGRIKIKVGDEEIDLRVSTLPTAFGEKVVIRLLRNTGTSLKLKDLGLRGVSLKRLEEALLKPYGIILVTGPTGSGKTVTLATCLRRLNTSRVNIITLEDPVEIRIAGVNQVQINNAAGLTFASGLRSILRQDPNIIMVGEIRDNETASLAINAALTGHSVLSTLHTNSAAGAVPRMLDMKVEPFLLASTLNVSMAQRLVRKICTSCKEEYKAPEAMAAQIRDVLKDKKGEAVPKEVTENGEITLYRGKGCEVCGSSGYKGRTGIYEVMEITETIVELMLANKSSGEIERKGIEEGMVTLMQDGVLKALEGLTTIEEVLRVARE